MSKIAPDGTLAYSTYLGGNGDDEAYGIYAGQDGVVYVTGWTGGIFPVTASAYQSTIKHNVINKPANASFVKASINRAAIRPGLRKHVVMFVRFARITTRYRGGRRRSSH